MNCPQCSFPEVTERAVDGRIQYRCANCQRRWYGPRGRTSEKDASLPLQRTLDSIADEVAARGRSDVTQETLAGANAGFNAPEELPRWAARHGFQWEANGPPPHYRFSWAVG